MAGTDASGNPSSPSYPSSPSALRKPSAFEGRQRGGLEGLRLDRQGAGGKRTAHFKRPEERPFTRKDRDSVDILYGGLSHRHDVLMGAAFGALGYRCVPIPTPTKADFQTGKEYGNNGQCNPTYFTVGALLNYLKGLRDNRGLSVEEIVENYAFVTAGSCGPCRFGMYEAEFRLALRNSGFGGFRALLFQQKSGVVSSGQEAGLDLSVEFFLALLNALLIGDLFNELANQIRPYEVVPGQTDRVFEKALNQMAQRMREKRFSPEERPVAGRAISIVLAPFDKSRTVAHIIEQLLGRYYVSTLEECREMVSEEIEVDFTRAKPICKITGEFWAQTTEGDGSFNMFRFLESQGAEVLAEPITTWVNYMLTHRRAQLLDRKGLGMGRGLAGKIKAEITSIQSIWRLSLTTKLVNREYDRLRAALGNTTHKQISQLELERIGRPYYNPKSSGGEGHLEVAKNIYYAKNHLAHMVMSLKPFGCMPSTQSDGAQAAVTSHYPEMIFIPIETSGEGDVNALSRAQMALGEAKAVCKDEFKACVEKTGYSLEQIQRFCRQDRALRNPLQSIPRHEGVVGKAANFVLYVGRLMDGPSAQGAQKRP